jgi:hypothetical protein
MLTQDEVVEQLVDFYYDYDRFQTHNLPKDEVSNTIGVLLDKGRIVYHEELGELLGYVESWRINYEQFGRRICNQHMKFDVGLENIQTGPVCYLANTTIRPSHRMGYVYMILADKFFEQNSDAEYFCGRASRKRPGLVKVFKASAIQRHKRRFLEGVTVNG